MYDQGVHDEINLARLIRRLEKSAALDEWKSVEENQDTWLKTEGILQRVKFARKLLKNCEALEDVDEKKTRLYMHWKGKLNHMEATMKDFRDRAKPKLSGPPPILPFIPAPTATDDAEHNKDSLSENQLTAAEELGRGEMPELPADQLLLSPSDTTTLPSANMPSAIPTLIPSDFSPSSAKAPNSAAVATGASRFLQNSHVLHQELSEQLAQMAVQLKRNALHFSESLEKDKAAVGETQQKLEGNFDVMQRERIRLRDHRGKSGSTTWMVVAIVFAAVLLFAMMVLLIRLTRIV
ncbi:hypothetical protein AX15_006071 [Amanita polypyramis BW_CC]|nr:hypothetical protein AX15_006071 [Amanita polypyramis BW_CC]